MKDTKSKGEIRRNKLIYSAIQLFIEQGYEETTTVEISKKAGLSSATFFSVFDNKEALLLALTKIMFEHQFSKAQAFAGDMEPIMFYCMETALQIHITELSEALRDLYVMVYTLPTTSDYIYKSMTPKLKALFTEYMPEAEDRDFYEIDIASSSIMRGFMSKPCDIYFTMQDKLRRYLECSLKLFDVPKGKRDTVIEKIVALDLKPVAQKLVEDTIKQAELGLAECRQI